MSINRDIAASGCPSWSHGTSEHAALLIPATVSPTNARPQKLVNMVSKTISTLRHLRDSSANMREAIINKDDMSAGLDTNREHRDG